MTDRLAPIERLDQLCWAARRYGHDDNGMEYAANENGVLGDDDDQYRFHPEAVTAADWILNNL